MRKLFLIARSNMRKAKGQSIAILVLITLSALMLNLWLMLSMDYKANFDRYHDKLNAEHVTISVDGNSDEIRDFLKQTLDNNYKISEYRLDDCQTMIGSFPYNGGQINGWLTFMEKSLATTRSIGKVEIVEEGEETSGIYLPMLYKSKDIAVGKDIEISIGSHQQTFTVCGFFNSIMMGSHNCVFTEIILSSDKYDELLSLGYAPVSTLCSIRLHNLSENLNVEADLKAKISTEFPNIIMLGNCYDIIAQSRYISQGICSAVMCVMAFLVLLIALVVIVSNIVNYIQVNIKNLGSLKALGYTSRQLILSLLTQFLCLTLFASVVGAGLSYCLFPAINTMMISQTGIPYTIRFLPLPIVVSFAVLCGLVSLFVWLTARKINKIEPIVALRSGVQTHNFKRNYVPLEKTKLPLNFALALKATLSSIKNNITVCITMFVLSLIVVFSGMLTENMIVDIMPFVNLIVGETSDSCINVNTDIEKEFLEVLHNDERVEKVNLYTTMNVTHYGGVEFMVNVCEDFSNLSNQSVVYKGRFPKYANEIAIAGKYAKEKSFDIGDEIEITANGKVEKYLITGLTQTTNNLGRDCLLTRDGYERLAKLPNASYYILLSNGTDIDEFNSEMKDRFSGNVWTAINVDSTVRSTCGVYVSLMTIIVIAILALSVVIIAFVLYLLVRTMLNNKKRDYGVMKSLGFTTKQLVLQTALSFMPSVIISTIVGVILSSIIINPLSSLFFSTIGIMKCTFKIPILFVTLSGLGLILLSFAIACLLSFKIKKITPHNLLVGE